VGARPVISSVPDRHAGNRRAGVDHDAAPGRHALDRALAA
jgi:hypothetical protein